jgi:peptidoglycan/LPS O-acetylase OafA/YrhL
VLPLRTSIDLVASLIAIPLLAANLTSKPTSTDAFLGRMSFPLYLWHWIPHTALVLGILKTGSAHWVNIAVALLASLAGGYALTWMDIRTDLIRSKAISGLNRALNKHQKPN